MRTALILLTTLWGVAASAASYTIHGVVTLSSGLISPAPSVVLADYPPVGATGKLSYRLDGTDADVLPSFGATPVIDATVKIGGWSAGFGKLGNGDVAIDSIDSQIGFFRFSPDIVTVGDPNETLAGSLIWRFSPALRAPVATYGDLRAAIAAGSAKAEFSFNGTVDGEIVEFAFVERAAPVPLPAPALLMLVGIAALSGLRRRD